VVAVARKLAVLLHRLWVTGEVYEPLREPSRKPTSRLEVIFRKAKVISKGEDWMSSRYKTRVWVTAVSVWVRYETAAKKAAPKTTRNPMCTGPLRSTECDGKSAVVCGDSVRPKEEQKFPR